MVPKNETSLLASKWPEFDASTFSPNYDTYIWKILPEKSKSPIDCVETSDYVDDTEQVKKIYEPCIDVTVNRSSLKLHKLYFKDLFAVPLYGETYESMQRYKRIIIPPSILAEINGLFDKYKLHKEATFLLETIAIVQELYQNLLLFWNNSKKPFYKAVKKDTALAIEVIENAGLDIKSFNKLKDIVKPNLKHISFKFKTGTIRIENEWIAREFILHMKHYYDNLESCDWRKDLAKLPDTFNMKESETKFKYSLVKAYYNFLTKSNLYPVDEEDPSPNQLMLCIAKLIEFSLIEVGDNDPEDIKIKHTRNWLERN